MTRTSRLWTCLVLAGAAIAPSSDVGAAKTEEMEKMRMERKRAAHRRRRIITSTSANGRSDRAREGANPENGVYNGSGALPRRAASSRTEMNCMARPNEEWF